MAQQLSVMHMQPKFLPLSTPASTYVSLRVTSQRAGRWLALAADASSKSPSSSCVSEAVLAAGSCTRMIENAKFGGMDSNKSEQNGISLRSCSLR